MKKTYKKELNDEKKFENLIRQNIIKLEEKMKIDIFNNHFINNTLLNACLNSINKRFSNLNDKIVGD